MDCRRRFSCHQGAGSLAKFIFTTLLCSVEIFLEAEKEKENISCIYILYD